MRNAILAAAICLAGSAALASPAQAREIERQQIGQYAATDRAPRTRTECIDRENGRDETGKEYRGCTEWRTQARIYLRRTHLVLDGPEKVSSDDQRMARACLKQAVASVQQIGEEKGTAAMALAAQGSFQGCAAAAAIENAEGYFLKIEENADWSGWR